MTTLHILSSPYNPANKDIRMDPFSILLWKFIKYMNDYGWGCVHYGITGTDVPCETVIVNNNLSDDRNHNINIYNTSAGEEIRKRKKPGDIIVCFHGIENKGACDMNKELKVVEPSIGYNTKAIWSPYRVFTSYAHMHMFYGERDMLMTPSWFDAVIPNGITADEFDYCEDKDDYILYFGRVIETKGVNIAVQASVETGVRLILAGPGHLHNMGYTEIPSTVEHVGLCDVEQRRKLMSKARAIIGPTYYVEPFGNMVVEGYFSGTPAITSDWGGFTETVINGITGYRCREFKEFCSAIENVSTINSKDCYDYAMNNYEDGVVHRQMHDYFIKIVEQNFYRK